MHRKARHVQTGHILTGLALAVLTVILAIAATLTGQAPAASGVPARMFQPDVMVAEQVRPVWNGYTPVRRTGPHAMCPASSYRLHRWTRIDPSSPWFRAECLPIGPGEYAWSVIR